MIRTVPALLLLALLAVAGLAACAPAPPPDASASATASDPPSASPTSALVPSATTSGPSQVVAGAELRVACDGTTTAIEAPVVRTTPDGIHLRFTNTSGQIVPFGIDDETGLAMLGDEVPLAGGTFVYTFGPGTYRVSCGGAPVAFDVVDPGGLFVPATLGCSDNSGTSGTIDCAADARGPRGSVLDVARTELRGLKTGDLVERAGYPLAADDIRVRVVRGGRVVAVIGYLADGHGGWLIGGTQACAGSNVTAVAPG